MDTLVPGPGLVQETTTVSSTIEAVVIRCGCEDKSPDGLMRTHGLNAEGSLLPCPSPRKVVDLGTVAFFHKDAAKQEAWDETGGPAAAARIAEANGDA